MENGKREEIKSNDAEEEKIDKFFALIRNFRDARNELEMIINNNNKRRKTHVDQKPSSWTPSFEWQDFTHVGFASPPTSLIFPNPNSHNNHHNQQQQDGKKQQEEEDEAKWFGP
ncbi:hypothetical protein Acr_13g0000410 [Actinidia rufa]|uniref:Uncharacterized protein n=1 Tax=Actinidia rufa TaxID=165716 RepID=A0A7J0FIX5_9ERIC|nr:hypothetical protein Acr_13g0000410 [Actinidia rufa]